MQNFTQRSCVYVTRTTNWTYLDTFFHFRKWIVSLGKIWTHVSSLRSSECYYTLAQKGGIHILGLYVRRQIRSVVHPASRATTNKIPPCPIYNPKLINHFSIWGETDYLITGWDSDLCGSLPCSVHYHSANIQMHKRVRPSSRHQSYSQRPIRISSVIVVCCIDIGG